MALYGYARVSTAEQDCTLQEQALRAAGCTIIRAEKVSGSRREGRTELALLLEFLRPGIRWWSRGWIAWRGASKTSRTLSIS